MCAGRHYPYLESCKDRTIYYWAGESFQPAARFGTALIKLVPTRWGPPTFEIDGIKMLPTAHVSPYEDAERKVGFIRPRGNILGVLLKSNVDYTWEANAGVDVRVPLRTHVSAISGGNVRVVGVDGSLHRETQTGRRIEGGVRFEGERGAIEVVVAGERRIDAYPLDVSSLSWWSAGFRFVSR